MSDYDREQWQAEQAAQDQAQTAYRDKMARARERSASNAKRKITRLHAKLTELGHISDFEDEFGESVLERLEKFGSAFNDLEKGRAGDALSIAQKQVVARMNKIFKSLTGFDRVEVKNEKFDEIPGCYKYLLVNQHTEFYDDAADPVVVEGDGDKVSNSIANNSGEAK